MKTLSVKNWEEFQHYKDRNPPWIKLHNALLNDYDFGRLQDASKMHLVSIWLLASQLDNQIPYDEKWVALRINATEPVDLETLIDHGFLIVEQDASKALSLARSVSASVSASENKKKVKERKPREKKNMTAEQSRRFEAWYAVYPNKKARGQAERAWLKLDPDDELTARMVQAVEAQIAWRERMASANQFAPEWKHPSTWLTSQSWDDQLEEPRQRSGHTGISRKDFNANLPNSAPITAKEATG